MSTLSCEIVPVLSTARSPESCGCDDFHGSRRRFIQGIGVLAGAGAVSAIAGSAFVQAAFASSPTSRNNVLVLVSMRGGVDGLSLVVPHGEGSRYTDLRPATAIPADKLLGRDAMFGLHPGFAPLMPMWEASQLAAVHAVGLEFPNRSHFAAMEAIEDADPGSSERRGWLNRLVSLDTGSNPAQAIQIGSSLMPGSLWGPEPVLAVSAIDDMFLPGRGTELAYARRVASLREAWSGPDTVDRRGALAALEMSIAFEGLADDDSEPSYGAVYPGGDLAKALAGAARLIRSDLGVEVITVDAGSWDMHVGLGTYNDGAMATSVAELAGSLAAFFADLGEADAARVTVVTISEFGRRVKENASHGFDHGWGNAMLLMGAGVKGKRYYGKWPGLAPAKLEEGDLKVTKDYRSVLAEVVRSRFSADVSKVFPGFQPERIGVMRKD